MDRKYPNALAYIKIEAVIRVKQKLWAVKIWAKMIWKQPSSFIKTYANAVTCQNMSYSYDDSMTHWSSRGL